MKLTPFCLKIIPYNNNIRVSIFCLFLWQGYLVFWTFCRWCIYLRFRKWSMSLANPARHGRKASEDAPLLVWSWWSTEQKPASWVLGDGFMVELSCKRAYTPSTTTILMGHHLSRKNWTTALCLCDQLVHRINFIESNYLWSLSS